LALLATAPLLAAIIKDTKCKIHNGRARSVRASRLRPGWTFFRATRSRVCATPAPAACIRCCAAARSRCSRRARSPTTRALLERYPDFDIQILQQDRGIKLELTNAPAEAFVDGRIIAGINELLFAVVRDIVYVATQIEASTFDLDDSHGITHAVFEILRNARVLRANVDPNLVVCWGGHSIGRDEYEYTKKVGYELGLRAFDICTGCGPGAMKGPMKGATIAHAKQRRIDNRYIGITEPGIIAAESPNPIVNNLIIMPDIEKRLEAFVRLGHAIIVFPGGVGTAEEILYLLGILLNPANASLPFPLIFTGPRESAAYFEQIDRFLRLSLGDDAAKHYSIVVDDPREVAHQVRKGVERVRSYRLENQDAFFFNWALHIEREFQVPFRPTHEAMAGLNLHRDQPPHRLAADFGARSRASSPATSRKTASARSRRTGRSSSTATATSCARDAACQLRRAAPHEAAGRQPVRAVLPRRDGLSRRPGAFEGLT
jgi:predicted Rossmann-fold nucleotide-binding protein